MGKMKLLGLSALLLIGAAMGGLVGDWALKPERGVAANISLISGAVDPSATTATFNSLINSINSTTATSGSGTPASAINIASVATAVNALSITPGGAGVPLQLGIGSGSGGAADANAGIVINPAGTGNIILGGSTGVWGGTGGVTCLGSATAPTGAHTTVQNWIIFRDTSGNNHFVPSC